MDMKSRAQSIKYLPCKRKGPKSIPRPHVNQAGHGGTCNPNGAKAVTPAMGASQSSLNSKCLSQQEGG